MSTYEAVDFSVKPVEGDDQVEVIIHASDGNKWEYGIPYSANGRYQFPEIDVIEMDFGEEFAEQLTAKVEEVVATLIDG
jgi:hypothetical protein